MLFFFLQFNTASPPPVNVVATQSSSPAPVVVSWSLPSVRANSITGYRIFYGSGKSVLVPPYVNSIVLNFVDSSQVGSVSIRSESTQLPSQLISASVTTTSESYTEVRSFKASRSKSSIHPLSSDPDQPDLLTYYSLVAAACG